MLGSAGIQIALGKREGRSPSLYFTGDIGRAGAPILRDPAPIPACDVLLCESTYGGRVHEPVMDAKERMIEAIRRTYDRGGKVIIPAFSVGRTQTLVYFMHEQMIAGSLPRFPIFIDSPLAVNATEVFKMHPDCYDAEARAFHKVTGDILGHNAVTYIREVEESKALNERRNSCTIISASGMCEAGRIRHHIKNNIGDVRNTILLPGFQAEGTLGRRLIDGAKEITLFHETHAVRSEIVQIHGFSGHADQADLLRHLTPLASPSRRVFLVHGEPEQSTPLAERLKAMTWSDVVVTERGMRVPL
jgi:metallo-beta-lactamase family protein